MFNIGLTAGDLRRVLWTFIQAFLAVAAADGAGWVNTGEFAWKAIFVGAIAAGVAAVKNLLLGEDSPLK